MATKATVIARHLVTVDGTQVEYLVAGRGPDVVLLHGLGDSADDWRGVMARLATSYRVYAPTLPGFGGPRRGVGHHGTVEPSVEGYAGFCHAFVTAKELQRPVLGGASLGGLIALRAALDRPERTRALVLIASAGLGRGVTPALQAAALPVLGDIAAGVARSRPGALLRAMGKVPMVFGRPWRVPQAWLTDQYRRAQDKLFMDTNLRALRMQVGVLGQRRIVLDELSALSVPALVLWGTNDRVIPIGQAYAAVARMPAGRLRLLDGLGHIPHVEDPDRVTAELRGFLATVAP
jgi:pimeloyl-ACP methyl ester carboxylesterase